MDVQDKSGLQAAPQAHAASTGAKIVELELYTSQQKIYPRTSTGWFASWRWAMVWFTQLLFYGAPWLTWNGRQAVMPFS